MEPAAEAKRLLAGVLDFHRNIELHRNRDFDHKAEFVRPDSAGSVVRLEDERHLGHLVGIFARLDLKRHRARKAVLGQVLGKALAELREADGNPAVERLAAVVVALRGTEDYFRMTRRAIGEDVRAEKRDFRRSVLVREDDVRVTAVTGAEHDAARSAIAGIELVDVHDVNIIPKFSPSIHRTEFHSDLPLSNTKRCWFARFQHRPNSIQNYRCLRNTLPTNWPRPR